MSMFAIESQLMPYTVPQKLKTDISPWLLRVKSIWDPLTMGICAARNLWPWRIVPAFYISLIGKIPIVIGSRLSSQRTWGNVQSYDGTVRLCVCFWHRTPLVGSVKKSYQTYLRISKKNFRFFRNWLCMHDIPCFSATVCNVCTCDPVGGNNTWPKLMLQKTTLIFVLIMSRNKILGI